MPVSEVYSEPCQTFKIERFLKIKNGWKPFTIFPKRYILHFWQGSEYASILRFLMLCKILLHLQILITTAMLDCRRMAIIWSGKQTEAATRGFLCKKVFLEISQNLQENSCDRVSFLIKLQACNFTEKETLSQVFSCELCEISKNAFFTGHFWTTASKQICLKV